MMMSSKEGRTRMKHGRREMKEAGDEQGKEEMNVDTTSASNEGGEKKHKGPS